MTRRSLISCVLLLVATASVSGGQPNDNASFLLPAEVAWTATLPAPAGGPGVLDETHVYIPLLNGTVLALDRETGSASWTRAVNETRSLLVVDGMLVVSTDAGLIALDAATGRLHWTTQASGGPLAPLVTLAGAIAGMSPSGIVVMFNLTRGELLWRRNVGPSKNHALAVDDGRLYLSLDDGRLVALAADDGRVLWEQSIPGVPGPPSAGNGRVFVGSSANALFALDARDGSLAWRWRTGGDVVGATPTSTRVYYTALDNRLRAVDRRSGNQRWQRALSTRPAHPPQVVGSAVVVTGVAPEVRAFDGATGDEIGTYVPPTDLHGPVLLDPNPRPYTVALAVITRGAEVIGLRPTRLQFTEPALTPIGMLDRLPGRSLSSP